MSYMDSCKLATGRLADFQVGEANRQLGVFCSICIVVVLSVSSAEAIRAQEK